LTSYFEVWYRFLLESDILETPDLAHSRRVVVIGEVLWDLFQDSTRLGGAPLNFAAHAARLGYEAWLVSAVGEDELGTSARKCIEVLGLSTRLVQNSSKFPTGTASVCFNASGHTVFRIRRPAAYDAVQLSQAEIDAISRWAPGWLYHGTLFSTTETGLNTLRRMIRALPGARRFYDVNLRPESYRPELVLELAAGAGVVKLNEAEMTEVAQFAGLPGSSLEMFCREGARRYGWQAACITLGARGCALWVNGEYVQEGGFPITVADPVGAGDGFSAALLHGLNLGWEAAKIAQFANRLGAIIASRSGGIPEWSLTEVVTVQSD
jgi:fructokinase